MSAKDYVVVSEMEGTWKVGGERIWLSNRWCAVPAEEARRCGAYGRKPDADEAEEIRRAVGE